MKISHLLDEIKKLTSRYPELNIEDLNLTFENHSTYYYTVNLDPKNKEVLVNISEQAWE